MISRAEQVAVIEKLDKRIAQYLEGATLTSASSDSEAEQARITERRLDKARVAKHNAEHRIAKLDSGLPIDAVIECVTLANEEMEDLQAVLSRFERRLSYSIARDRFFNFVGLSEKTLGHVKRIIQLTAAIKTGGATLL